MSRLSRASIISDLKVTQQIRQKQKQQREEENKCLGTTLQVKLYVLFIFAVLGGASYHTYTLVDQLMEYKVQSNVTAVQRPPPFPLVTVCNDHLFNFYVTRIRIPPTTSRYYSTLRNVNQVFTRLLFPNTTGTINELENVTHSERIMHEYSMRSAALEWALKNDFANTPENGLLYCEYNNGLCQAANITTIVVGNQICFRFRASPSNEHDGDENNATSSQKLQPSSSPPPIGTKNGLIIGVHTPRSNLYSRSLLSGSVRSRVFLHSPEEWPDSVPVSNIYLMRKHYITATYKYKQWSLIATPKQPCQSPTRTVQRCYLSSGGRHRCEKFRITKTTCNFDQLQADLVRKCGCTSRDWWLTQAQLNTTSCFSTPDAAFLSTKAPILNPQTGGWELTLPNRSQVPMQTVLPDMDLIHRRIRCYWTYKQSIYDNVKSADQCPGWQENCEGGEYTSNAEAVTELLKRATTLDYKLFWRTILDYLKIRMIQDNNVSNATFEMLSKYSESRIRSHYSSYSPVLILNSAENQYSIIKQYIPFGTIEFILTIVNLVGLWAGFSLLTVFEFWEWLYFKMKKRLENEN